MKKVIVLLAMVLLSNMAARAETEGAMMGGGMMNEGQGEGQQAAQAGPLGTLLFNERCKVCHRDGGNIEKRDLPLKGSPVLKDFDTFLAYIRNPTMPDGSRGEMPAPARGLFCRNGQGGTVS